MRTAAQACSTEPHRPIADVDQGLLRRDANWAFLKRRRDALRRRSEARLDMHRARAKPGSIAALLAAMQRGSDTEPAGQASQSLFAFDAAGIATLRALALLSAHPEAAARARNEAFARETELPFLRACLLRSVGCGRPRR